MLKLIQNDFDEYDEVPIRIIKDWSAGELIKEAADNQITEYVKKLTPEQGKTYLHILAMSAGEAYSSNRNGDWFPEENLKKYYKTFETNPAHVFRSHINKNPAIAIGQVVYSIYNDRMRRVELIAWVDNIKAADVIERLENGDYPSTSMALKTPADTCSICGNVARTRAEYCTHLNNEINRMYPDGRKVMAINDHPLNAFDISVVIRPADPISAVMQKVASHGHSPVIGSAELAEIEGLTEKTAAHKKLSELIKEIEGNVVDYDSNLDSILSKVQDPLHSSIPALANHELGEVFSTMAHLGITPSLRFLADLIGHKIVGEEAHGIGELVEGYIGSKGVQEMLMGEKSFGDVSEPNRHIVSILSPSVKQASLLPERVIDRSDYAPMIHSGNGYYVPGTNVGYIGNGPHVEETPVERFNRLIGTPEAHRPSGIMSMIKSLIVIGGAALAAKWYITNAIEKKMQEAQANANHGVKIVLVKASNDYRSTYRLAKSAMVKSLGKL